MIHLQKDDAKAKTNDESIAQHFEDAGFVRQQRKRTWKEVAKSFIKDFIKTFLAILAGTIVASWVDPGVNWATLTVCAMWTLCAYEFFGRGE